MPSLSKSKSKYLVGIGDNKPVFILSESDDDDEQKHGFTKKRSFKSLTPLFSPNEERFVAYVCGQSGAGKTHYISKMIDIWRYQNPTFKKRVFLFSRKSYDKLLDDKNVIRIQINEQMVEDPIQYEEFTNSLVIFDDTDTIDDKDLLNAVNNIRNQILECGRHTKTSTIVVSHQPANGNKTKNVLSECGFVVIFPRYSGNRNNLNRLLKNYLGLSRGQIRMIWTMGKKSRALLISKNFPQYLMSDKEIILLDCLD